MDSGQRLHRRAPWRKQVGTIIKIVTIVAVGAISMMCYLSVSARMTDKKLRIETLQEERSERSRQVADLTTDEGVLTSYESMMKRAQDAGYVPIDFTNQDEYTYLIIDGYNGTGVKGVPRATENEPVGGSLLKPEYTVSLWQWLQEQIAVGIRSNEIGY